MRCDYNYRIIYRNQKGEQYSFTSCKWFGNIESALANFETVMNIGRETVTDVYRLIKNQNEPIVQA